MCGPGGFSYLGSVANALLLGGRARYQSQDLTCVSTPQKPSHSVVRALDKACVTIEHCTCNTANRRHCRDHRSQYMHALPRSLAEDKTPPRSIVSEPWYPGRARQYNGNSPKLLDYCIETSLFSHALSLCVPGADSFTRSRNQWTDRPTVVSLLLPHLTALDHRRVPPPPIYLLAYARVFPDQHTGALEEVQFERLIRDVRWLANNPLSLRMRCPSF